MTAALAVETRALSKTYGAHRVLHDLDLAVPTGATYGFIGANGAGKTTTIRILLGLTAATSGTATVLGVPRGALPADPVDSVAYLPDVPELLPWMRPVDALVHLARLSGVPADSAAERAPDLLDLVGLARARGRVGGFSRGMKQRFGIAAALVGSPSLLVLDEPTSALDPLGRADVLAILRRLRGHATVLFSSHLLGDVQEVCTHVGMLHEGRLVAQGPIDDVLAGEGAAADDEAVVRLTLPAADLDRVTRAVADALAAAGADAAIRREPASLQSVYERLTGRRR